MSPDVLLLKWMVRIALSEKVLKEAHILQAE